METHSLKKWTAQQKLMKAIINNIRFYNFWGESGYLSIFLFLNLLFALPVNGVYMTGDNCLCSTRERRQILMQQLKWQTHYIHCNYNLSNKQAANYRATVQIFQWHSSEETGYDFIYFKCKALSVVGTAGKSNHLARSAKV